MKYSDYLSRLTLANRRVHFPFIRHPILNKLNALIEPLSALLIGNAGFAIAHYDL
jgi:hypothetical protein